jgi:hypothetical protein
MSRTLARLSASKTALANDSGSLATNILSICIVFDEDQSFCWCRWLANRMAPFLFRCPNTGFNVQGWIAEAVENDDGDKYEAVTCLACQQLHLVNPKSGKKAWPRLGFISVLMLDLEIVTAIQAV